ncbi:TRAP transporter large permease subunit [Azospirillum sp. YIM B02556]|uniref:TRAP transporter large permease subunit n=1 Tax=Azospirillum endophyticum TaxID=2800326 RepID=A0ABS1F8M9_9PROT|nr:TRAP transporter large permease subunit [Azospirillum endophyticum]MBK1839799.1 TRAP transporter large permease subunit [Azospirillum endophyticum]
MTTARTASAGPIAGGGEHPLLRLEALLGAATEALAGALLLVETAILFVGVLARYFAQSPIIWVDEVASTLFIWLAMLGAVIALRRTEHMRLTTVVGAMNGVWRARCEAASLLLALALVLFLIGPSLEYTVEQVAIVKPVTEISDAYRTAAIPVGLGLMALFLLRMIVTSLPWQRAAAVVACGLVLAGAAWLGRDALTELGNWNLVLFFVLMIGVMIMIGVPIAFAFGLATSSFLQTVTDLPESIVISRLDEGMSSIILLSIPLFIFLGHLIVATGLARAMVMFLVALLGHIRGGLSYTLIAAMYLVSGISGAKAADMAAVAPVLFPEMKRRGADEGELAALLAASGAMAETIPPSIVLIIIGSVASVSISALFIAGLMPALIGAVMLAVVVFLRSRRADAAGAGHPAVEWAGWPAVGRALALAVPALILPLIIRAAVVEGVATATEVATIGVVYSLLVGILLYRRFDPADLFRMLVETASLSGSILFIIGTASGMAWALTQSGLANELSALLTGMGGGKTGFLLVSILIFVVLGSLLEGPPALLVFAPLLFPVARMMGVHEVHYAMIVILAMGLGLFAPPFGVGYYFTCAIGKISPDAGLRHIWIYLSAIFVALILVTLIPWLSLGFLG